MTVQQFILSLKTLLRLTTAITNGLLSPDITFLIRLYFKAHNECCLRNMLQLMLKFEFCGPDVNMCQLFCNLWKKQAASVGGLKHSFCYRLSKDQNPYNSKYDQITPNIFHSNKFENFWKCFFLVDFENCSEQSIDFD